MNQEIKKPQGSTWTDEQWGAISTRGHNLLVAAAAGSGKTAVLVERIIRYIADEENPVDVDRLLVATFTKAAADEMRQRIREALEAELLKRPSSTHLKRQIAFIHRASITTLHSFCMDVIRRYFALIPLDPDFRIANTTESDLLQQDILEQLLEELYADSDDNSPFWDLVEWYGGERDDEGLYQLIIKLYHESRSHPWPDHWLQEMADQFDCDDLDSGTSSIWQHSLVQDVELELKAILGWLQEAITIAKKPGGPDPYIENLQDDLTQLEGLQQSTSQHWNDMVLAFQTVSFGRLRACKGDDFDPVLQEEVKKLRDQAKKKIATLKEELFQRTQEEFLEELQIMAPLMQKLAAMIIEFSHRYEEEKKRKGLLDFSDLEHYCLRILCEPDSLQNELIPSQAAKEYQEQFVEILLDEYQDTNEVQEAIVQLISRPHAGNRFMVGDVKQSIYRFRLAEPGLFLEKYHSYRQKLFPSTESDKEVVEIESERIDLAKNFRSRKQVIDSVNFIFKQVMNETAAEIEYDKNAELVCGANYPEATEDCSVELALIDRGEDSTVSAEDNIDAPLEDNEEQLETVQLEARYVAAQIHELMNRSYSVFDKRIGSMRPITYRDIVILLRSTQYWAPIFVEELQNHGIPAYADLNIGYFNATEVEVMLSLLKIIDNPYQDIPLAAVLRSPMFHLTANELALIRIQTKHQPYYEAVKSYTQLSTAEPELKNKLERFLKLLKHWQTEAREGSLADLIWKLYQETSYYDFVGGMPGGIQRQANLRALYDRARQYEATSLRGVFRFLRFIERMRERGGDLGAARALGEQEDVVRILSIHKSKGLEFPVVFVAGLAKMFNQQDIKRPFLVHKKLGFGAKFVDLKLRVSYPTFPWLAMKRRMRKEMLAEEMRILYVALTRAREKLFLVGTFKELDKQLQNWNRFTDGDTWFLPDYELVKANCYLDWIGPALIRHPQAQAIRSAKESILMKQMESEASEWKIHIVRTDFLAAQAQAAATIDTKRVEEWKKTYLENQLPIEIEENPWKEQIHHQLDWKYPYPSASKIFSKTSVSEMKRLQERQSYSVEERDTFETMDTLLSPPASSLHRSFLRRPKFMEQQKLTAAERGTMYHLVMQHVPMHPDLTIEHIKQTLDQMQRKELLTAEQKDIIDANDILIFFQTAIGQRMLQARKVMREVPFSYGISAGELYTDIDEISQAETVLIQGVIDCLFEDEHGMVLIDYKTDAVYGKQLEQLKERYALQIQLYARAIEETWRKPITEKYVYFFDGTHLIDMD